ncbi:hypothetical protein FGIG_11090 [Fasciola gigantica]|uniref:Uncharacterized protein n=1 Tax=Fasciola gigantica TaxID=46835 RepID=A0A504YFB0_FASGI|nr:hypothetical protein FGIG_11090 [Fasciola gigantica]
MPSRLCFCSLRDDLHDPYSSGGAICQVERSSSTPGEISGCLEKQERVYDQILARPNNQPQPPAVHMAQLEEDRRNLMNHIDSMQREISLFLNFAEAEL